MPTATAKTESWDDRIDRERLEKKDLIWEFIEKLLTVSLDGWTAVVSKHDSHDNPHAVTFNHVTTGASFYVTTPGSYASRQGKVEALATWPSDADGNRKDGRDWGLYSYSESDPFAIGFSFKKTAKAIQIDLARRLVPGILEGIAKVNEKLETQEAEKTNIDADIASLTAAFHEVDIREQSYCYAKGSFDGGSFRLSNYSPIEDDEGNTVDLELENLSVEQAVAIAKLLRSL